MDIPGLSIALAQNQVMSDVGVAMLSKSLDTLETVGTNMVDMMETSLELSVNPAVGANIDMYL